MAVFKPTGLKGYSSDAQQCFVLRMETREEPSLTLSAAEAAWLWPLLKKYAEQQAKREAELAELRAQPAPVFPSAHDGRGTFLDHTGRTRDENTYEEWYPPVP